MVKRFDQLRTTIRLSWWVRSKVMGCIVYILDAFLSIANAVGITVPFDNVRTVLFLIVIGLVLQSVFVTLIVIFIAY